MSKILQNAKSLYMPNEIKKFNKRKHRKEGWMTSELLVKVVRKNELYVNWKTTSLIHEYYETIKTEFKYCEKEVLRDIANAKKLYYNKIFNAYKKDMKKMWRTINETLTRNKQGSEIPSILFHDDKELTNPTEIANAFNVYFANIGKNLAADIESSISTDQSYTQYLLNPTKEKCIFRCATQDEVVKAINNLENKRSSGHDGISNKVLKSILKMK